jgi:hypothetical protein
MLLPNTPPIPRPEMEQGFPYKKKRSIGGVQSSRSALIKSVENVHGVPYRVLSGLVASKNPSGSSRKVPGSPQAFGFSARASLA